MAEQVEITLDRGDRVYRFGEKVRGAVVVKTKSSFAHKGINLTVQGRVNLQLSARSIGLLEAFYSTLKPVDILHIEIEAQAAGKVPAGTTEFPFEFTLEPLKDQSLFDTYHGVYVNVEYSMVVDIPRVLLSKDMKVSKELVVEMGPDIERRKVELKAQPFKFKMSPDSLQNVKDSSRARVPQFLFEGHLDHTACDIARPFTGEITIKKCDINIKSIELQLVRVESCVYMEGEAREATEVQNIQIADGNIPRGLSIPIHMVFPRLFTCATAGHSAFKVEFEVNLIVLFVDDHMVTENFPIKLYR